MQPGWGSPSSLPAWLWKLWRPYLLCIRDAAHGTLRPALHSHGVSLGALGSVGLPGVAVALLRPRLRPLLLRVGVVPSVGLRPHLPHLIHRARWLQGNVGHVRHIRNGSFKHPSFPKTPAENLGQAGAKEKLVCLFPGPKSQSYFWNYSRTPAALPKPPFHQEQAQ